MDKKVTITLTIDQLSIVMAALSELPLKTSLGVYGFIRKSADEQLKPRPAGPLSDKVVS